MLFFCKASRQEKQWSTVSHPNQNVQARSWWTLVRGLLSYLHKISKIHYHSESYSVWNLQSLAVQEMALDFTKTCVTSPGTLQMTNICWETCGHVTHNVGWGERRTGRAGLLFILSLDEVFYLCGFSPIHLVSTNERLKYCWKKSLWQADSQIFSRWFIMMPRSSLNTGHGLVVQMH